MDGATKQAVAVKAKHGEPVCTKEVAERRNHALLTEIIRIGYLRIAHHESAFAARTLYAQVGNTSFEIPNHHPMRSAADREVKVFQSAG